MEDYLIGCIDGIIRDNEPTDVWAIVEDRYGEVGISILENNFNFQCPDAV